MLITIRQTKKPSPFILYLLAFILSLFFSLSWALANEKPKPKPEPWQINGIIAALDDSYPRVKEYAFDKLGEYELKDLQSKKQEEIIQKAANFLKDEKVDARVRGSAASALGNFGSSAVKYFPDILNFLKDEKVDADVRRDAASALGNFGSSAVKYLPDILNFLKDEKVDANVRGDAASALGNFGSSAVKYLPDILNILKDEKVDARVRGDAASALGNFGSSAVKYLPDILNFLKDEKVDANVRGDAARALGNFGSSAVKYLPDILNFLKDEKVDANVRAYAASALGNFGSSAVKYLPDILNILKDEKVDDYVRAYAARALGNFGSSAVKYLPDILNFLKDEKVHVGVRGSAASALGNFGSSAVKYLPDIVNILKDEKVDDYVRGSAASALGNFGSSAVKYLPDIVNILKDEKVDDYVRGSAASALGNFGSSAVKYLPDILNFLKDENVYSYVRGDAASALGNFGSDAVKYLPDIVNFLKDEKVDAGVRGNAARTLGNIRQLELEQVVVILNYIYEPNQGRFWTNTSLCGIFEYWRFLTYFLGGGTDEVKTLLTWLGRPEKLPTELKYEDGKKTLEIFLKAWNSSQDLKRLQNDLAQNIADVAKKVSDWKAQDITLLQRHYHNLKGRYNEADTVHTVINNLEFWKWFFLFQRIILVHLIIWLAFIFAYPKLPQALSMFFWNTWVRRILGFGYIGLLLSSVPFLHRKLFEPFKLYLIADAGLDNFNDQTYFPQSLVKVPIASALPQSFTSKRRWGIRFLKLRGISSQPEKGTANSIPPEIQPITQALPAIKGQIVLEGDSGYGKSMFLRHLVKTSHRIVVYLPAQKCDEGVIEAIQAKLKTQVHDAKFLKNLICNGAIDICIDGLNEVTSDTRAKISHFVERYFQGNIIMSTQPLEWTPPSTAKKYELQPLQPQQIKEFLISRQPNNTDYQQACSRYIASAFNEQQSPEDLAAAKRILSNPMDLTLVAQMLSQGKQPDLFHLQQQQYQLMAAEYLREWNHEFPLKKFSQAVYQMRLNDETAIPRDEFNQELTIMADEKYKMVVSRQWENPIGEAHKNWYFRHDKIMEFFLVQNFLGESEEVELRINKHIGEPRFRGVYLLLATLLPLDAALELREKLIEYAAHTKDHTVVDTFVQILMLRLPQWSQRGTFKELLRQQEQKAKSLDSASVFLELVGAKIKRENSRELIIQTIEGRLSSYAPIPVLLTVDTPTDGDVIRLVQISEKLVLESPERVSILFYKVSPDATARMEMAKVRLRDYFVLIPIPLAQVEQALPNQAECRGLLEVYVERYQERADFFDDKNAISDTFSFFGRTEILQRLGEELLRYQGIGLLGLRKSGKTSVLFQLGFLLREYPIIHIDLQRYGGSRYGAALFNDILQSLSNLIQEVKLPHFRQTNGIRI